MVCVRGLTSKRVVANTLLYSTAERNQPDSSDHVLITITILVLHVIVINLWWLRMVDDLTVEEVADHLASGLVHVRDASTLQEATLASDLPKEGVNISPRSDAVVLHELVMLDPVEQGSHRPYWVNNVLDADRLAQDERVSLLLR